MIEVTLFIILLQFILNIFLVFCSYNTNYDTIIHLLNNNKDITLKFIDMTENFYNNYDEDEDEDEDDDEYDDEDVYDDTQKHDKEDDYEKEDTEDEEKHEEGGYEEDDYEEDDNKEDNN